MLVHKRTLMVLSSFFLARGSSALGRASECRSVYDPRSSSVISLLSTPLLHCLERLKRRPRLLLLPLARGLAAASPSDSYMCGSAISRLLQNDRKAASIFSLNFSLSENHFCIYNFFKTNFINYIDDRPKFT